MAAEDLQRRLAQSLAALKEYFDLSRGSEKIGNPGQLVLFAEHAIKHGYNDIAAESIELYLGLDPPANQFLIRAHLCQAHIAAPTNSAEEAKLVESLGFVVKAVDIAKKSECYSFLVYNASLLLWQLCRPFQQPGSRWVFCKPLQTVARALEEVREEDQEWRLELLIALVHCQLDGGQREEAAKTCTSAVHLARKRVPARSVEVMRLQVSHNLGDAKLFDKEMKSSPELTAIHRLHKVKCAIQQQALSAAEMEQKLRKVFAFITKGEESSSGRKTATLTPLPAPHIESRPTLLLELAAVCVECHLTELASACLTGLPRDLPDPKLALLREYVQCQLMVQQLGAAQESYTRTAVEVRLQAIRRMEEALTSSLRLGDPELIQHACVVMWNLTLPLLQHNLHCHLLKPLTAAASALERISSLLHRLRCSVHFELAKICTGQNQLQTALEHLHKASSLDPHGERSESIGHLQHRLVLRSQLYQIPQQAEDRAAQIIEQASGSGDGSGSADNLRSVLVKAGDLLAPDCFTHALGAPSTPVKTKTLRATGSQALAGLLQEKGRKLRDYELAKDQVEKHAKTLEPGAERERCHLWADLTKTARKQEVMDIALAAAKFCLLYDDERWSLQPQRNSKSDAKQHSSGRLTPPHRTSSPKMDKRDSTTFGSFTPDHGKRPSFKKGEEESRTKTTRELLRTLAEVHSLHGECLVYHLQQEGLSLGDRPSVPAGSAAGEAEESEQWKAYCEWASQVCADAHKSFLRAAELGCSLGEPWLVSNAAAYLWNYSRHYIAQGRPRELVGVFRPLLASIKQAQIKSEASLVCHVCTVLAGGLVQKWMPKPGAQPPSAAAQSGKKGVGRQESRAGKKGKGGGDAGQLQVDPEAGPELKEALEVCEYGMGVWVGVPVAVRGGLLAVWVQCKQLLQQPIPSKTMGVEEESGDPHTHQCRAVVAVEIICRMGNKIWEFPNCPTLQEAQSLLTGCQWDSKLTEIELWTQLGHLALKQEEFEMVCQCAERALEVGSRKTSGETQPKKAVKKDSRVESELLSLSSSLLGQSLVATAAGNMAATRRALEAFLESAKHGHQAKSYQRVIEACRHYWNTCLPLVSSALERELLKHPLSELLSLVAAFTGRRGKQRDAISEAGITPGEQDLMLQAAMYGVVFQSYADKCVWEEGLKAIEDAMWVTPKTIHRHLAQHKLVFKSKMGRNVEGDMIRFQEEPEDFLASLWYKAASSATDPKEQLSAYQNAIEALKSPAHSWQKVEYLLEFSEWLFQHQFPVQDALDQLQWATDILLKMAEGSDNGNIESQQSYKDTTESPPASTPTPAHTPPSPHTLTSVKQLEALTRAHVMMAQLQGRGNALHQNLCLSALGYCSLMWKHTLAAVGRSDKGKPSSCQIPKSAEEWADFSLPEEAKEDIKSGSDATSLNSATITRSALTSHYLGVLVKELTSLGLLPLSLPVLALQLVVAECITGSRPLCQLIHMRIVSVCLAMGLQSAAEAHSKMVGPAILDPEDLARSHEEMEQYRAKQEAVEREESKRSVHFSPETKQGPEKKPVPETQQQRKQYSLSDGVSLREVWVEEAKLLIKQGQYQVARELLNEAQLSSQVFSDGHTLVQCLLGQASLSLAEKDFAKAISLLLEAQKLPASLGVWCEGVLLLLESMAREEGYSDQNTAVLERALSVLQTVGLKNRNEADKVEYAQAILKARLVVLDIQSSFHLTGDTCPKHCDVLDQSAKALLKLGHQQEAAQVLVQHANMLRRLGVASENAKHHKEWLLQALSLYEKATEALQAVFENAKTLSQTSESASLPVQRELVSVQLSVVDLLMEIFAEHSGKLREGRSRQQQKSSIEKMIDDYVRETPVLPPVEQEWQNTASVAVEKSLGILSSAHNLAKYNKGLQAKCAYSSGHCLRLLAAHTDPDEELQWRGCGSGRGEMPLGGGAHHSTLSTVMRREEADNAEVAEGSSLHYLSSACQFLAQAAVLALECGNPETAAKAALEVVDCCGCHDPVTSSLYLALHQSCVASLELFALLSWSQPDPSKSQLAALLEQHTLLLLLENSSHTSPALSATLEKLKTFECWRRLRVNPTHLELLKNFPSHFRFIVLQHSPDRTHLYAAYIVPPQPPPPAPKKGQPPPPIESHEPVVVRAAVVPRVLDSLLELTRGYQLNVAQKLLKMQGSWKEDANEAVEQDQTLYDVEGQFPDILAAMEAYLSEVTASMEEALKKESSEKELTVVLLADLNLLQLPLEALSCLHGHNLASVSRDFSLQVLSHRIAKFAPEDSDKPAESSKEKKRGSEKYQPQPATLLANTTNIKYILDPRNDIKSSGEKGNPACEILSQIQAFAKLTSKWSGHSGTDHTLSIGEWPALLQGCSGLLFFGPERILAHLPPSRLAPLSLKECSIAVVMDQTQTPDSALCQSRLDLQKTPADLSLEQPLQAVMLLSLVGAGCVLTNQWHTTIRANEEKMKSIISGLLSNSSTVGSLNWGTLKQTSVKDDVELVAGGEAQKEEDCAEEEHKSRNLGAVYNCVVYGLPHITLVAANL